MDTAILEPPKGGQRKTHYRESQSPWMTRAEAADYRRLSVDTIDKLSVVWTDEPPTGGRIRYKQMQVGNQWLPRLWREDVINSGFKIPADD